MKYSTGNQIIGDFNVDIFDENGSDRLGKNNNQTFLWINFHSKVMPKQSFWLKIRRKQLNDYPILIKSISKETNNLLTTSEAMSCHFIGISHLIKHPLTYKQRRGKIPFADGNTYIHESEISICGGISGIASLPGGKSIVRIESTSGDELISARLTQIPKLSFENMTQLEGHHEMKSAADGVLRRWHKLQRVKRSFRMPVHDMPGPFLVELYLVVDSKMASMYSGSNYSKLLARIKSIMNQINVAFMQFNIYFTVVQLEIWEQDQIKLTDENHILMELQLYKRQFITKKHDCLHAILGENLGSARRGQAEPASMCGYNRCVGYTKDYWGLSELEIAHSVMHELGHNFGLSHDTERCKCYGCIMATGVEFGSLKFQWSNCSRDQITGLLNSGMSDCLKDLPVTDFGNLRPIVMSQNRASKTLVEVSMSKCGNGVVDDGEECDCGGSAQCSVASSRCCNPDTCRLRARAQCASGACCDLSSCSINAIGSVCRSSGRRDCDLSEYCDGVSEWCPTDVYKNDGVPCRTTDVGDWSHCYHGECHSRQSWCRVLHGDTGNEASSTCYDMNRVGNEIKNCGLEIPLKEDRYTRPKYWNTRPCNDDNLQCGRLWCSHDNERVLRQSPQLEIDQVVNGYHCSASRFFLDGFFDDAGLVPNGSPCGRGKMCWRGLCIHSVYNDMGGCYCHGHGVCNNRGHCHCDPGFAPANCTESGNGGSVDSGPLPKYHLYSTMVIAGILIFIVLTITILSIATLIYHYNTRQWPPIFAKFKWPDYQVLSHTFKGCGIGSNSRLKSLQGKNKSTAILLTDLQLETDKTEDKSDAVLQQCLKRINSDTEQLSLDELNSVLDNVFRKQSESIVESNESSKPENNYSKFTRAPVAQLNINKEIKYQPNKNNQSTLGSPTDPKITDELIYANIPQSSIIKKSPPVKKNPNKPSQVKTKALIFEKKKIDGNNSVAFQNPRLDTETAKSRNHPQLKSTQRAVSIIERDPSSNRPPIANHKPVRPNIATKPKFTAINHSIERPTIVADNNKPKNVDKVIYGYEKGRSGPVIAKEESRVPVTDSNSKSQPSKTLPSTTRTTKDQISQPRLNQTTCTAKTRDLPATDETLTRIVEPHKIIKIDPHKAVKYLY